MKTGYVFLILLVFDVGDEMFAASKTLDDVFVEPFFKMALGI